MSRYAIEMAMTTATPWLADLAERLLEQLGDGRLAEEADAERGHRDPELAGGQVLVDVVELLERERGAADALVAHLLEPRLTRAHEAELGRHEEAVRGDQNQHSGQEEEFCH